MLSANQRLVFARELENPHTAPEALRIILADEGMDFDKQPINDLNLTEKDYRQLSSMLTTQGPQAVMETVRQIQATNEEAQRIEGVIASWLAVHPEYVMNERNAEVLKWFIDEQDLQWTKSNLELAWHTLMEQRKLEEDPQGGLNFRIPGQRDPGRVADGDVLPRKAPSRMTAAEFAEAISRSRRFRDKINEPPAAVSNSGSTEAERTLRAENIRKQADKQELKRTINQMPSKTYDEWVKIPENRAVVESLYAEA